MNHIDYLEAGFKVIGINPIKEGVCACGNENCPPTNAGKHPIMKNWQITPHWSEEQLENMEEAGHFAFAFGVICKDFIIIDIDPRNGGDINDIPKEWVENCGFIVRTGGSGWHLYYRLPEHHGKALSAHLSEYKGIDFKSSGFVIGAGSMHRLGTQYEKESGHPCDITEAPESLLEALEKPAVYKADNGGDYIDVTDADLEEMLSHVDPDSDYDQWIKIGMAIHHATHGTGFDHWDNWSRGGRKYTGLSVTDHHWHSFGKSSNPVTIGTLIHYAEQGGYKQSVTFEMPPEVVAEEEDNEGIDINGLDLLRPPGFVGDVTAWINSQCKFPRERLAVASALASMGTIAGLSYKDGDYGVNSNLFMFCVAGSSTGKEDIMQATYKVIQAAGMSGATCGDIKSEQEIVRNLMENQACLFMIDELGIKLKKITNSQKNGGASYLEGVIGMLMSAYSKSDGVMPLSGDAKKTFTKDVLAEIAKSARKVEENDDKTGIHKKRVECFEALLNTIDAGIEKPFLSMIGYTTPGTFDAFVDYEQATNGFIGRALVVRESDNNPRFKKGFKKTLMSDNMKISLSQIATCGNSDKYSVRIQNYNDLQPVDSTTEALALIERIIDNLQDMAGTDAISNHSLEPIVRRAIEMVLKVSLILAVPSGLRTVEHVLWAYAYVKRDIDQKVQLAKANIEEGHKLSADSLTMKILTLIDDETGQTEGVIFNRCRKYKKEDVMKCLSILEEGGTLERIKNSGAGRPSYRWIKC